MLEAPGSIASPLPLILDVADKLLKLVAVALGGVWTYWNYRKSRTCAQKLELPLSGSTFPRSGICVEVNLSIKNLGSSQHRVQQRGSSCFITAIFEDLSEELLVGFPISSLHEHIEPGETITDHLAFRLTKDPLKAHLAQTQPPRRLWKNRME
jgi:hypothetical protein